MMVLGHPLTFEEFLRETRAERAARVFRERGVQGLIEEGLIEQPRSPMEGGGVSLGQAFENLMLATPTTFVEAAQRLIPGEQQLERLTREVGPFEAWAQMQWPSLLVPGLPKVTGAVARQLGGPMAGPVLGKVAEAITPTQLGPKGAAEAFLQPDVLIPPMRPVVAGARGVAAAGVRGAQAAGRAARPLVAEAAQKAVPAARRMAAAEAGAIRLEREEVGARIKKFLDPQLDSRFKAVNKAVEDVGYKMDALAGTRQDEYFVALDRPKGKGYWGVTEEQLDRMSPELKDFTSTHKGSVSRLFFKSFDDVDIFLATGQYKAPSITSPLRKGPIKAVYVTETPRMPAEPKGVSEQEIARRYFESAARLYDSAAEAEQGAILRAAGLEQGRATTQFAALPPEAQLRVKRVLESPRGGELQQAVSQAKEAERISELRKSLMAAQEDLADQTRHLEFLKKLRPYRIYFTLDAADLRRLKTRVAVKDSAVQKITKAFEEASVKPPGEFGEFMSVEGGEELSRLGDALRGAGYDPRLVRNESVSFARELAAKKEVTVRGFEEQLRQVTPGRVAEVPPAEVARGQAEMPVAEAVAEPAPGLPIPGVRRPTEPVTPGAAWETGTSRPFAFDPNSTVNQGRFRLLPPIKGGSYITRQSGTPGVAYIVDTESNAIQSVRFNKAKFTEEQAGQWWEANKARFGRGPAEPVTPTAAEPVTAAGAAPGARQQTEDVLRIARSGTGDIPPAVEAQSAFAQAADPSGAPPGKVPPRVRRAPRPEPGPEPEGVLEAVTRQATRGERLDQTLLRRHEAAVTAAENEARVFLNEGVQRLRAAKLGAMRTGRWVPREQDLPLMDELFEALHNPGKVASGEMRVPGRLEVDYARLRELTDWEEAMRIDFDPAMATVEDYFYRGWLMPKEGVPKMAAGVPRGRLGAVPAFKKPRVNATYREMRELGFEPISWNPYEQWRISRLQGVRYREQMQLIDHLKKLDLATTDAAGLGAEGWRTPRVGPAFEGKVFATTDSTGAPVAMYSRRWVVPDSLAGSLESAYGVPPSLGNVHVGKRTVDLMKVIDAVVFIPKRVKLFGSLFQQFDFLMRNYVGAWSGMVDALTAGRPVEAARRLAIWPKSAVDIVRANLSPGFRASLRQQLNSTTPLVKGRSGVHLRGIMEGGLSTIDTTILPRDLDKTARVVAEEAGLLGNKVVRRALGSIESSMRRGLFEGVYPAAQITDIKNNIAPMIVRRYGSLSDEALNGMIAQVTNKKYSTIPASQSVLQSRPLREILRRLFFSISETEGLLRQATGAIRGPEAGYWRTHYIGAYLGLIALASIIHFASTGKPLPWGRWTPVSKDKWGILPVGYNQKFAAPDLPIKGTEGRNITLDMVGQLDTAFRILDPVSFLAARESVPIRASVTQLTERDYFGRPITDVGPGGIYSRTANLANDLFAPIGIGQAAGQIALREAGVPKGLIPMSERGLTTTGQLIQATGLNVRAQYLRELWEADLKPYLDIPGDDRKAEAEGKQPRDAYLNDNPEVDAKVFIIGQRESVLTYSAKLEVVRLMRENNIKVADLKSMEVRDYEKTTDERVKLRNWLLTQLREGEEAEQEAAFQAWLKQGSAYKPQREPTPVGAR